MERKRAYSSISFYVTRTCENCDSQHHWLEHIILHYATHTTYMNLIAIHITHINIQIGFRSMLIHFAIAHVFTIHTHIGTTILLW